MNTSKKLEAITSIHQIKRFSKSGIPVYKSKVPKRSGRKTIYKVNTFCQKVNIGITYNVVHIHLIQDEGQKLVPTSRTNFPL